ncbi:hypothetical protein ACFFJX_05925 [Pseudarcicella hirudinis]|uniref:hypothetical protein n=1 Tax=Pseudarcicella hirudinis TaxID=1079859 RepID=UPI0035E592F5
MKQFNIKVGSPSNYWSDFEGELCVYGFLKWQNSDSIRLLSDKITSFTWDYINLSQKYGIAIPVKTFQSMYHFETEYFHYKSKFEDERQHNPLFFIQILNDNWLFPSVLFVSSTEQPKKIICIEPLLELEEAKGKEFFILVQCL